MKIRYRAPTGGGALDLDDSATVAQLVDKIKSELGYDAFHLKYGWPPQTLASDKAQVRVSELGLQKENLTVVPIETAREQPPPPSLPSASAADIVKVDMSESGSSLVLRVMPDDGDCMFTAVSGALSGLLPPAGSSDYAPATLRRIVVDTIRANPDHYNATTLDKAPEAYCQNMLRSGVWGGAIELSILSDVFRLEICALDIGNSTMYRFGEGNNFVQFAIVIYSGVHYDRIAEVLFSGQDNLVEFDVTRWSTVGNDHVLRAADAIAKKLHQHHYYTNTSDFLVSCDACGELLQGEKHVTAHARATGHVGVTEIKD